MTPAPTIRVGARCVTKANDSHGIIAGNWAVVVAAETASSASSDSEVEYIDLEVYASEADAKLRSSMLLGSYEEEDEAAIVEMPMAVKIFERIKRSALGNMIGKGWRDLLESPSAIVESPDAIDVSTDPLIGQSITFAVPTDGAEGMMGIKMLKAKVVRPQDDKALRYVCKVVDDADKGEEMEFAVEAGFIRGQLARNDSDKSGPSSAGSMLPAEKSYPFAIILGHLQGVVGKLDAAHIVRRPDLFSAHSVLEMARAFDPGAFGAADRLTVKGADADDPILAKMEQVMVRMNDKVASASGKASFPTSDPTRDRKSVV